MLENPIEDQFVRKMSKLGWTNIKCDVIKRGWADRMFFGWYRRTVIVEFKRDNAPKKRKGEKLQNYIRADFKRKGFPTYKAVGLEEAKITFHQITLRKWETV